ncbi:hypothetical protein SAMN04487895_106365 [Paenibacillus sophorae]|uniref:Uncharacterized protein n=1 Tax=Paenibacillus sophorae TaxID=1333845 RepID=A0A1H8NQZ1_9BACL|nr:hypothetical protein [Paenibacillus sophorae]QWU14501.1 hypothetical protein KP014_21585 [Paenibacillus sophorae]SEO31969.1 hypothetical protein SAMN04487895_106365 [Paenibacillus sophorae]
MSTYSGPQTLIYQADPTALHHVKKVRESMHGSLKPYINRKVRIQTIDGVTHEGMISGIDEGHLYLTMQASGPSMRGYYNPYYPPYPYYYPVNPIGNVILPLVLYNLLAISLL